MTLLAGFIVQLLHVALMSAAAPTLIGVQSWMRARLAGRAGPPILQPWRELSRLLRKQVVLAETASAVTGVASAVSAAATAIVLWLVPSFALRMVSARLADLLVIAGVLALARCAVALAALDAGSALGGVGASRSMLLACLEEPAFLLVLFVLALLAGSLNVDVIAAMQTESGTAWRTAVGIALTATLLIALAGTRRSDVMAVEFAGSNLALIKATDALRLLVWFNLIGVMFLPFGMAPASDGAGAWVVGLICWLIRTALFAATLALLHALLGFIRVPRMAQVLGVAMLLGLLAAMVVFGEMVTA
jgi:formate hydrogenlyase subunit 4